MADWYYAQGMVQRGPVPIEFVVDSLRSGVLKSGDLVWREGLADWTAAGQLPELAGARRAAFAPPPLPAMTPAPSLPPAPFAPTLARQPPDSTAARFGQSSLSPVRSPYASLAATSFLMGVVGFALLPFGVPALICGVIALRGMKRTGMTENRGMAIAGVVLGIFWAIVGAMVVAAAVLYLVLQPTMMNVTVSPPTQTSQPPAFNINP